MKDYLLKMLKGKLKLCPIPNNKSFPEGRPITLNQMYNGKIQKLPNRLKRQT